MFHSSTPQHNKDVILKSVTQIDGIVCVVFATVALGMGVNIKDIIRYDRNMCPDVSEMMCALWCTQMIIFKKAGEEDAVEIMRVPSYSGSLSTVQSEKSLHVFVIESRQM